MENQELDEDRSPNDSQPEVDRKQNRSAHTVNFTSQLFD